MRVALPIQTPRQDRRRHRRHRRARPVEYERLIFPCANGEDHVAILPASGGPFIGGEGFHAVSLGTNLTGTIRVKKLPWNAIWLDIQVTYNATAQATINCGSLPDATYYPTGNRQFPLSTTGAPSGIASSFPRVSLGSSGILQILVPSYAATGSQLSCSVMYPTN